LWGKVIWEQRESNRTTEDKTVNATRMLGMSPRLWYVVLANSVKVFKFLTTECVRGSMEFKWLANEEQ
jgi:hypothetical protein